MAPAGLDPGVLTSAGHHSATYVEADGDVVTVTVSRGDVAHIAAYTEPGSDAIAWLQFDGKEFGGADIHVRVRPRDVHGDGLVELERLGSDESLRSVSVAGNLGMIRTGALEILHLGSFGGEVSASISSDLPSEVHGGLGTFTVNHDIDGAHLDVYRRLGLLSVGGSIIGGDAKYSGVIKAARFGEIHVQGNIVGGDGEFSGGFSALGSLGALTVDGSVLGGGGFNSGGLVAYDSFTLSASGTIHVRGDVRGGEGTRSADLSGTIYRRGDCTIDGSVIGGIGSESGQVYGRAKVRIHGDVIGGTGGDSGLVGGGETTGFLQVDGSVLGGSISAANTTVTIGGSLVGTDRKNSGFIGAGNAQSIRIAGDVDGGAGDYSGCIDSFNHPGSIWIGGALRGGGGYASGAIQYGGGLYSEVSAGAVTVGGSVTGGSGTFSGSIECDRHLGEVRIGGDLIGGTGNSTGVVSATDCPRLEIGGSILGGTGINGVTGGAFFVGRIAHVTVGHDIVGGSIQAGEASLATSGFLLAGNIGSAEIGGDVRTGFDNSADGQLIQNGCIVATIKLGTLHIGGSLMGSVGTGGDITRAIVSGDGPLDPARSSAGEVAISSVAIDRNVRLASILGGLYGGYAPPLPQNADARIGPVTVGGDWIASELLAGVSVQTDGGGAEHVAKLSGDHVRDNSHRSSVIGSIVIKGHLLSSADAPQVQSWFGAQKIRSFSLGGNHLPLSSRTDGLIDLGAGQLAEIGGR